VRAPHLLGDRALAAQEQLRQSGAIDRLPVHVARVRAVALAPQVAHEAAVGAPRRLARVAVRGEPDRAAAGDPYPERTPVAVTQRHGQPRPVGRQHGAAERAAPRRVVRRRATVRRDPHEFALVAALL
ncbi:hypothetical protein RZS08_00475, partial [Arthrospira platensis SPKY1]|nr:hypothetical protein [Arthrospira platensis SPKY1]